MYELRIAVFFIASTLVIVYGRRTAPKKTLNDGYKIPGLGLGTWMGFDETGVDSNRPVGDEVQLGVEWAIDAGYRLFDTALVYYTEEQLWSAFHKREDVIKGLQQSLSNLNMDYVDLYLIHFPVAINNDGNITSFSTTDYVETWQGMIGVQKQGLTKSIGVSNFNQTQLERLMSKSTVKPAVLENEVNLNQQPSVLLSFCRRHNITVLAYTPFGSLFKEKPRPGAPPPRVDDPKLVRIAKKHKKTVPEVALRYLLELGVIPIPKSINKCHIKENFNVFDFTLTKRDRCVLKSFNRYYRTLDISPWKDSPYYPYNDKIL